MRCEPQEHRGPHTEGPARRGVQSVACTAEEGGCPSLAHLMGDKCPVLLSGQGEVISAQLPRCFHKVETTQQFLSQIVFSVIEVLVLG